ncbi:MAG TPA: hypothetical protein PK306_25430 [Aquabacterium sp.]|nr:hypothetical protein [Aquabacterium sp.]
MIAALVGNLPLLAGAPGGVRRLRELVLDLAANGRLGNADAEWRATQLRELVDSSGAGWSPSCDARPRCGDEWGVLKVSAVSWGQFLPDENKALPANLAPRPELEVQPGDFLVSRANTADLVARSVVVEDTPPRLMLSDKIVRLRLSEACAPRFVQIANSAPEARRYYARVAGGTSSSMKNVSREQILALPVLLPPLAEQHRIVAKVDELMALCDRLEARQQDAEAAHARLVQALLDSLTQARDADEFQACWQRVAGHFGTLFVSEDSLKALRQAAIDCATSGQFQPSTGSTEWRDGCFGDLVVESGSGWSPSCEPRQRNDAEWGVLKVSAVSWGSFRPDENKALPASLTARPEFEIRPGDFLISRANTADLVARSVFVETTPPKLMLSDKIVRLRFSDACEPRFAQLANSSTAARRYYAEVAGGTSSSMKNVTRSQILALPIKYPGLAEQRRIVAKVTELLALCDQLKARIAAARAKHAQLAEALVAQAVAA